MGEGGRRGSSCPQMSVSEGATRKHLLSFSTLAFGHQEECKDMKTASVSFGLNINNLKISWMVHMREKELFQDQRFQDVTSCKSCNPFLLLLSFFMHSSILRFLFQFRFLFWKCIKHIYNQIMHLLQFTFQKKCNTKNNCLDVH